MAITPTPIFQIVPDTVIAIELYRPANPERLESIVLVNTSVGSVVVSIYHDIDGKLFDDTNILLHDTTIAAGARLLFDDRVLMNDSGSIGVKVDTIDVVTITGYSWVDF